MMIDGRKAGRIIRREIDDSLSFLDSRPSLRGRIMSEIKGGKAVKKKVSLSLALVLILIAVSGAIAVAAAYRGAAYFLTENAFAPVSIDPDYLMHSLRQNHTAEHLHAAVTDAYWDGLELTIAYRISPADASHIAHVQCDDPLHTHSMPAVDADILLHEPRFVITTDANENVSLIDDLSRFFLTGDWIYEEDGSITAAIRFPFYGMTQPVHVGIPIHHTMTGTGEKIEAMLHIHFPALKDPISPHEHQWAESTCVSPRTCTVCGRTEGGLGLHDFRLTGDGSARVCGVCTTELAAPKEIPASFTLQRGDYTNHVWLLQLQLNDRGLYDGPLSGKYDEATEDAVRAWQERAGLPADGVCRPDTLRALFPESGE